MLQLFHLFTVLSLSLHGASSGRTESIVDWQSETSIERFSRSPYKVDFFPLSNYFVSQPDGISCGPTSASIVLNALRHGRSGLPKASMESKLLKYVPKDWDPRLEKFTPHNIFSLAKGAKTLEEVYGKPMKGKQDFGFQIRQLHQFMLALGLKSQLRIVDDKLKEKQIREEFQKNLKTKGDFILINYKRSVLGQEGGGHISPVAVYDEESDSVLVLDVNPSSVPWNWVPLSSLIKAMKTHDTVENRGYLLISE